MVNQLRQYNLDFGNPEYFGNIYNLLFPHINYTKKEQKLFENVMNRVTLLKIVIFYCRYRFPD